MEFDCDVVKSGSTVNSWDAVHQAWCCEQQLKCAHDWSPRAGLVAKDCRAGIPSYGLPDETMSWCCLVCPAAPVIAESDAAKLGNHSHDCLTGMWHWWSASKRADCCKDMGLGCDKASLEAAEAEERAWEAKENRIENHDCQVGRHQSLAHWKAGKLEWCCKHWGVGCPLDGKSSAASTVPVVDCKNVDDRAFPALKRDFCCKYHGLGCDRKAVVVAPVPR